MSVTVKFQDTAAIVELDNPPVNAIGHSLRCALLLAIENLNSNTNIDRVVLTGSATVFAAGADAREFDGPLKPPHLPDITMSIEQASVPWIAAITGVALGGGAELALACRYRIAASSAAIGFPEVTLGVVPGAGGTQRLPRLVGMSVALDMISTGKPVKCPQALKTGLIDAVDDNPLQAALTLNLTEIGNREALSVCTLPDGDTQAVENARKHVGRRMANQNAPVVAIDLIEGASALSFEDGMRRERSAFIALRQSDQAKALRHVFFGERGAKIPSNLKNVSPLPVSSALVVGGGNMGASIAYALDGAGIKTSVIESSPEAAERAKGNMAKLFNDAVKRGLLNAEVLEQRIAGVPVLIGYDNLPDAQLVIEAAFEDMAVKKSIFKSLQQQLSSSCIFATNTSYLDIDEIAQELEQPDRLIGLHFFSPAHIMKLLEIVRGANSSDSALSTGFALAKRLRKIPVLSGVCDGFIGNRILARYREAADALLLDGSTPWDVDEAMVEFGYAMGPYEAQDLSGLDIAFANRQRQAPTRDPKRRYIAIGDRLVEEGRLGRKAGVGWYRYPEGRGKVIDPLVEDLILEESRLAQVKRREFTRQDIQTRLVAAMVNEASCILDEGIAQKAIDIDLVLLHGYGFPRWRGGLLFHAETVGLSVIADQIRGYAAVDPTTWTLSPLLEDQAVNNGSFS